MTEPGTTDTEPAAVLPREAFTRTPEHYVFAVLGYLVLGIVTKTFLTFTMALAYFVLTLDFLPRGYAWLRHPSWPRRTKPPTEVPR